MDAIKSDRIFPNNKIDIVIQEQGKDTSTYLDMQCAQVSAQ